MKAKSESKYTFFSILTHFIIAYHISLMKNQANYCNNNPLILDVKQLNKIMKLYYFHALKALWDGQGKIKMYYGMSRVKKQLSGKRSINIYSRFKSFPRFKSTLILVHKSVPLVLHS